MAQSINNLIDWFSNLFFKESEDVNNFENLDENFDESFILLDHDSDHKSNTDIIYGAIVNCIDPKILQKYSANHRTYNSITKRFDIFECCICWEEKRPVANLSCNHSICHECYIRMINKNYTDCPFCRMPMSLSCENNRYAIFVITNNQFNVLNDHNKQNICLGIIYYPPIYNESENKWSEYDLICMFGMMSASVKYYHQIIHNLKTNNYSAVHTTPFVQMFIDKYFPIKHIPELRVIQC